MSGGGFYITPPPFSGVPFCWEQNGNLPTKGRQAPASGGRLEKGGGVTDYRSKSYHEAKKKDEQASHPPSKPSTPSTTHQ